MFEILLILFLLQFLIGPADRWSLVWVKRFLVLEVVVFCCGNGVFSSVILSLWFLNDVLVFWPVLHVTLNLRHYRALTGYGRFRLPDYVNFVRVLVTFGFLWSVSAVERNRLAHALNGNISLMRKVLIAFIIYLVIALPLSVLEGYYKVFSDSEIVAARLGKTKKWARWVSNWVESSTIGFIGGVILVLLIPALAIIVGAFMLAHWLYKSFMHLMKVRRYLKLKGSVVVHPKVTSPWVTTFDQDGIMNGSKRKYSSMFPEDHSGDESDSSVRAVKDFPPKRTFPLGYLVDGVPALTAKHPSPQVPDPSGSDIEVVDARTTD